MTDKYPEETKYPLIEFLVFLVPAVISFFGADVVYQLAEGALLEGVENAFLVVGIKLILFFTYLIPLAIGALLLNVKNIFIHTLALLFLGLGCGVVFKMALAFVGIINPYRF